MRQHALFIALFLGLLCTGGAVARLETPIYNFTAYQLRLSLLDESCRISDDGAQRFYKQRRLNDTGYYGFSGNEQLPRCFNLPSGELFCPRVTYYENIKEKSEEYEIIPYNLWREGRRQPRQQDFHWCVYLLNTKHDIHVCLNVNGTYEITPAAEMLQLSSYFTVPPNTTGSGGGYMIIHHPDYVLDRAVISCRVNISTFTGISYHSLLLRDPRHLPKTVGFPKTGREFLILGEPKNFSCEIIATPTVGLWRLRWEHNGEAVTKVQSLEDLCNPLYSDNCTSTSYYTLVNYPDELSGCRTSNNSLRQVTGMARNTLYLVVSSASANDTGNYTCVARNARTNQLLQSRSLFISVMFLEFPSNATLLLGENATLTCIVKATEGAVVQWLLDGQPLPLVEDSTVCGDSSNSNGTVAVVSESPLRRNFSIYHAKLTICSVEYSHQGRFTCRVKTSTDTEKAEMSIDSYVRSSSSNLQDVDDSIIAIYIALPIVVVTLLGALTGITCIMCVLLKRRSPSSVKRQLSAHNTMYKMALNSPGIKPDPLEFPRSQLVMEETLGSGRFGLVMKAQARGIAPDQPHLNVVAVKTTKRDDAMQTEIETLWSELEIMKQITPHPNICNLLAYCTTPGGPLCIIMEYAMHGSLKDYLRTCKENVLSSGAPLRITNLEGGEEGEDGSFLPGSLGEEDVCNFAYQIAEGLHHLENLNILHRDVAARNVLIAERMVLKVADFGSSKDLDEDEYYQKLTSGLIPAKWAALEVLEKQLYTHKSDVWSFGVMMWEIASYGDTPYPKFSLGMTMEPFVNYLRDGHRLQKPDGLSDSFMTIKERLDGDLLGTDQLVDFLLMHMDPQADRDAD